MTYPKRSSESEMHMTANRSVLSMPALFAALLLSTPAAAQDPGAPPPSPPSTRAPSPDAPPSPPSAYAPPSPPSAYAPPPGYTSPPGLGGAPAVQPILVTGLPRTLLYREDSPPLRGYRLETRPKRGLLIASVSLLGGVWAVSALAAGTVLSEGGDDGSKYWPLLLPAAGPFITLETMNADDEEDSPVVSLVLLSGLAQATGLATLVGGLLFKEKIWVRNDIPMKTSLRSPEVLLGPTGGAVRFTF